LPRQRSGSTSQQTCQPRGRLLQKSKTTPYKGGLVWPALGSEDTELGVSMELEVGHGEPEVHARVQA
jgi:hypothetical protein